MLGKSGSGKSTLLKLLAGLLPPTDGQYQFKGQNVYALPDAKRKLLCTQAIGFVWQNYRLISELNVFDNIALPAWINKKSVDHRYIEQLLDLLGIAQYAYSYPDQLSGGEQQRVALARALSLKPDVILADEPTGALDSKTSEQIMDLMIETRRRFNTLFVIATHDPQVAQLGSRIIELQDGQVM